MKIEVYNRIFRCGARSCVDEVKFHVYTPVGRRIVVTVSSAGYAEKSQLLASRLIPLTVCNPSLQSELDRKHNA